MTALHLLLAIPMLIASIVARAVASADRTPRQKPLMFYYSQVAWDDVWQRPQEFALALARHADVVYFGPVQFHNKLTARGRHHPRRVVKLSDGSRLRVRTPSLLSGHYKNRVIHAISSRIMCWEAAFVCPSPPDLLVTNSPFVADLPRALGAQRVVMDFIDDFAAFSWAPSNAQESQRRLMDQVTARVAGTSYLARKYTTPTQPCPYIPSGVDAARWFAALERDTPVPVEFADAPRPWIGYAGTISDRLDRGLLARLAAEYKHGTIIMIGPVHGSFGGTLDAPNFRWLGQRPATDLPAMVKWFDVGIIPFVVNDATRALNPVKAMDYLAAGVPAVAVRLPDLQEEFSQTIALADTHDEFVAQVNDALALSQEGRAERRAKGHLAVRERTWATLGERYRAVLWDAMEAPPR